MSKRFGRNQRRKMREQLAAGQELLACEQRQLKALRNHLSDLKYEMDEAKRIAGNLSIIFPSQEKGQAGHGMDYIDYSPMPRMNYDFNDGAVSKMQTFKRIRLPILLGHVHEDALENAVHFRLRFPDDSLGYAISKEYLGCMTKESIEREVCGAMAHAIHEKFSKPNQRLK